MINISNEKFYRLLALNPTDNRSGTSVVWECLCDCGATCFVSSNNLRRGLQKSCGCWRREFSTSHGMSYTRIYSLWGAMLSRVNCKEANKNHGGRGIKVCDEWLAFENFQEDMVGTYSEGLELDRIDVNGDYSLENCRWVDKSIQAFNKRLDKANKSGKTGVYLHEPTGEWDVKIGKDRKSIYLGRYNTFEEAVSVREEAELKYFGFNKE